MGFVKLVPSEGRPALSVAAVIQRLRDEFTYVEVDPEEGRDVVGQMIAATLRLPDAVPGKRERVAMLQEAQSQAVYVTFADDIESGAGCCVMPASELFFSRPEEVDGAARALVERAAAALGYQSRGG